MGGEKSKKLDYFYFSHLVVPHIFRHGTDRVAIRLIKDTYRTHILTNFYTVVVLQLISVLLMVYSMIFFNIWYSIFK